MPSRPLSVLTEVLSMTETARDGAAEGGSDGDSIGEFGLSLEPEPVLVLAVESGGRTAGFASESGEGDTERDELENEAADLEACVVMEAQSLWEKRSVCSALSSEEGRVMGNAVRNSSGSCDGESEQMLAASDVSKLAADRILTRSFHTARFSLHCLAYSLVATIENLCQPVNSKSQARDTYAECLLLSTRTMVLQMFQ
jgi:hypothetical protein